MKLGHDLNSRLPVFTLDFFGIKSFADFRHAGGLGQQKPPTSAAQPAAPPSAPVVEGLAACLTETASNSAGDDSQDADVSVKHLDKRMRYQQSKKVSSTPAPVVPPATSLPPAAASQGQQGESGEDLRTGSRPMSAFGESQSAQRTVEERIDLMGMAESPAAGKEIFWLTFSPFLVHNFINTKVLVFLAKVLHKFVFSRFWRPMRDVAASTSVPLYSN
jgi:hypothetical protein